MSIYKYDNKQFTERASNLIFNSGKTQAELVEILGLSNGSIANLKNKKGVIPSAETVCALANYFNVSTDWLLGLTDVKSTDKATKSLCDTLGLSEETIELLQEKTKINNAINFLFYQDKMHKKFLELDENEGVRKIETVFEADMWTSFSILKLLTEFIELSNNSLRDDIYYSITPDGVVQLGKVTIDKSGDIDGLKMEKSFDTHLVNKGFEITSMTANRMQRIINILTAQLQNFVEDKIIFGQWEINREGE